MESWVDHRSILLHTLLSPEFECLPGIERRNALCQRVRSFLRSECYKDRLRQKDEEPHGLWCYEGIAIGYFLPVAE